MAFIGVNRMTVARGLMELALEVVGYEREIEGVRWYEIPGPVGAHSHVPVVPRAVHDVLCPDLVVAIADKDVLVCDRCELAVEVSPT